ncbi:hypothetical protein GOEFS_060_00300 [Gordonia effusa NBRC 100432]|uniref:Uncharacterized protein n=1 Tax=Gordonia effusa NBRC 100432 TaxID=1077974 RepID=H0R0N6_9ACTN|nr:hypothetical protein GOEFS_060_00300 [Gordonia effusa NBRC 100432]
MVPTLMVECPASVVSHGAHTDGRVPGEALAESGVSRPRKLKCKPAQFNSTAAEGRTTIAYRRHNALGRQLSCGFGGASRA